MQALSTRVAMPWERERGTVDDMVRVAQACDAAGFLYVAACHHVAIPREPAEMMSTTWFDPVATLGFLAAHTQRTRLMTNVYVAVVPAPARDREGVRDGRRALERPAAVRRRRRSRRR